MQRPTYTPAHLNTSNIFSKSMMYGHTCGHTVVHAVYAYSQKWTHTQLTFTSLHVNELGYLHMQPAYATCLHINNHQGTYIFLTLPLARRLGLDLDSIEAPTSLNAYRLTCLHTHVHAPSQTYITSMAWHLHTYIPASPAYSLMYKWYTCIHHLCLLHLHTYMFTHLHADICTNSRTHKPHSCTFLNTYIPTNMYTFDYIFLYLHSYTFTYLGTYMFAYIHLCVLTHPLLHHNFLSDIFHFQYHCSGCEPAYLCRRQVYIYIKQRCQKRLSTNKTLNFGMFPYHSLPTFLHEHQCIQMRCNVLIFFLLSYIPICFDKSLIFINVDTPIYPLFQTATSYAQICLHA